MILFLVLLLVAVAILIAAGAGAIDKARKLPPAPHERPKLPAYEQPALPPPPEKKFQKRSPPPPPPGGTTGNFKRRVVSGKRSGRPNFNLPCRITGQPMSVCGCARCRQLREKHGV